MFLLTQAPPHTPEEIWVDLNAAERVPFDRPGGSRLFEDYECMVYADARRERLEVMVVPWMGLISRLRLSFQGSVARDPIALYVSPGSVHGTGVGRDWRRFGREVLPQHR